MDNHFRDLKIKELTEQLAMAREENKTLKSQVSDLEAERGASRNSRSVEFPPFYIPEYYESDNPLHRPPSDNKCNQADVR